ncbi:Gfo/Idh/MocA family oxidoreductase, partial [bacterium]|nr:Gfo/Idh/MocA family oxidoreductase [bacterium]
MSHERFFNIAVIGAGRMGRRHIHVIRRLKLDLIGVIDSSTDALSAAKAEHWLDDCQLFDSMERF